MPKKGVITMTEHDFSFKEVPPLNTREYVTYGYEDFLKNGFPEGHIIPFPGNAKSVHPGFNPKIPLSEVYAYRLTTIKSQPIYKLERRESVGATRYAAGAITGERCTRSICIKTTKREQFPEHDNGNGNSYTKEEWLEMVAHEDDEGEEVPWEYGEYTENVPVGEDSRNRYDKLIPQDIDFLGKSPKKEDYSNPKIRAYWIGEIYLRESARGRSAYDIGTAIGNYFGVSRQTVMVCAKRSQKSNEQGFISLADGKAVTLEERPIQAFEGDWVLKNAIVQKFQPPWMTSDGLRPLSQWGRLGASDRQCVALRQRL
jgi:hypothetical protein